MDRLDELANDSRLELLPRMPVLKRFYTDAMADFLRRNRERVLKEQPGRRSSVTLIIQGAMRELARRIALDPGDLLHLEWRDLERVLREVFEGLGFETLLTRSSKDGGFDLELSHEAGGLRLVYVVEVKHWREKKPGPAVYSAFFDVVVRQGAQKGLLLSTSGFTKPLLQAHIQFRRQTVRLGSADKVIEFCQHYVRRERGLWETEPTLSHLLLEGTL